MFTQIENSPRPYPWGSRTAIAEYLGYTPSGEPEAELWLGDHPGAPARLVSGDGDLRDVVRAPLPYLLKVLAADSALSLQAHPTREQATVGFAAEQLRAVPIEAPHRNYKDQNHKPELVVAVSETFDALAGFRPVPQSVRLLEALRQSLPVRRFIDRLGAPDGLRDAVRWLLSGDRAVARLVDDIVTGANDLDGLEYETVRDLASTYPGDAGVVIGLLLHRVRLRRGEALYLPAGNIHAYLRSVAIELMASSDNVLRGGLTNKHIDAGELLTVLDFAQTPPPVLTPATPQDGVRVFTPDVPDFELTHLDLEAAGGRASLTPSGPAVLLVTSGTVRLSDSSPAHSESMTLARGDAVYCESRDLELVGDASVFMAAPGGTPTRERDAGA